MHVDEASGGDGECIGSDQHAECHDHGHIQAVHVAQEWADLPARLGLVDRNPMGSCTLLDGRRPRRLRSPPRAIGLGDHGFDVGNPTERIQRQHCDIGCAEEDGPHS